MCAKVYGPLHSDSATGKIGNAIVFFPWKGLSVVRKWIIPLNRKSIEQGDQRRILGGVGRATRCIEKTSLYYDDAVIVAPSSQTWVSAIVKYIINTYMKDLTAYEAFITLYGTCTEAAKAQFVTSAADLQLIAFDVNYGTPSKTFLGSYQLFLLGLYGIAMRDPGKEPDPVFNRSPYDTAMTAWVAAEVLELEADVQAV